jgi:hypothetical protein
MPRCAGPQWGVLCQKADGRLGGGWKMAPDGNDDEDIGQLCDECERTLQQRPVGWWIRTLESKFPGLQVVFRETKKPAISHRE